MSREGWHQLEGEMRGLGIRIWLDGKLVLETGDSSWAGGRIGVWTKSDAITEFDDFEVRAPR